jgi:hypothetical protein
VLESLHQPQTKRFPTVRRRTWEPSPPSCSPDEAAGSSAPRVVHLVGPRRYTALDVAATLSGLSGRDLVPRELPRSEWVAALQRGGAGASYAELVAELFDAQNAGQIDAEQGAGAVRHRTTELREALSGCCESRPAGNRQAPPVCQRPARGGPAQREARLLPLGQASSLGAPLRPSARYRRRRVPVRPAPTRNVVLREMRAPRPRLPRPSVGPTPV